MKRTTLLLVLILVYLFSFGQIDSLVCVGAVGDVKWSILDPVKFQEVNGDCWTLMNGIDLPADSKLKAMGFSSIPDGQGLFLRAIDMRTEGRLDPDRPRGTRAGDFQADQIKSHNHTYEMRFDRNGSENLYTMVTTDNKDERKETRRTSSTGGKETRPKNIALYLYIRIN